ncbi:MAG: UvrD-helicase domain-containing protein [Gemmatimonadaceae bacterium]
MKFQPTRRQVEAIEAPLGPVLVVAGPGAGKTYCLIERIAFLIRSHGIAPDRICAVTFTNRAAEEIATRLEETVGDDAHRLRKGTLHKLCVTILREHAEALGLSRAFGIADEDYQRRVLRRIGVRERDKTDLLNLFRCRLLQGMELPADKERCFQDYRARLQQRNMLDFDSIIAFTAALFREHPEIADSVAERWDYVLVDEFQDLTREHYWIVTRLAHAHHNIFVVGDDDQSIYSWAGADPRILGHFQEEYDVSPIILESNHRCSRQIFQPARRLLAGQSGLFFKELEATHDSEFEVESYGFPDEQEEAHWLLGDLLGDQERSGLPWGEYAVLYRKHAIGNGIEAHLLRNGIRCRLARGRAAQDDPVIKFVSKALAIALDPDDDAAVEGLAQEMLEVTLSQRIQMFAGTGAFLDAVRSFAKSEGKSNDGKQAWRFYFQARNLAALKPRHASLEPLVNDLLSERMERYANVLDDFHDDINDPAGDSDVVALAEKFSVVSAAGGRVWVPLLHGVEIGLVGMLRGAGIEAMVQHAGTPDPGTTDLVLDITTAARGNLPLRVYKALQNLHASNLVDPWRRYVTFDIETTDRNPDLCEIVEIGAARYVDGQVTERFQCLIQCDAPISAAATAIHGYSGNDLLEAPQFSEAWSRFLQFVGRDILVAHNGWKFDIRVLRRLARDLGGLDDLSFYDTLPLASFLFPGNASLGSLAGRFGVDAGRSHHALDDALALAHVHSHLCRLKAIRTRKTSLVHLLDYLGLALALGNRDGWTNEHHVLFDVARKRSLGGYSDCLDIYESESQRLPPDDRPATEEVIARLGGRKLMDSLRRDRTAEDRYPESVARLRVLVDEAGRADSLDDGIRRFLEIVALSTTDGAEVCTDRVNLLTLHSTKGLEFSRVYIVGTEDRQLLSKFQPENMPVAEVEEARRVLYVGMTRARERLVLTRVDRRGNEDGGGNMFLDEMDIAPGNPKQAGRPKLAVVAGFSEE